MKPNTQSYWQTIIHEWEQSGLTQVDFCKQRNLNVKALYNWKSLLKKKADHHLPLCSNKKGTNSPFIKLNIDSASNPKPLTLRIGEVELDVDNTTDRDLALSWIALLASGGAA